MFFMKKLTPARGKILNALGAIFLLASPGMATVDAGAIEVNGTDLRLITPEGQILTGQALIGAVIGIRDANGQAAHIEIENAILDPDNPNSQRWLYNLIVNDPVTGVRHNFCDPGPKGLQLGFPLRGTMTDDGGFNPSDTEFTFSCTGGAVSKCIRMGYAPWKDASTGEPLLDHFRACIRMIRADYCGNGTPHTRNGTVINIYDRLGIQKSERLPGMVFEAAWGPKGAICVRKTRIQDIWQLNDIAGMCGSRLDERMGENCSEVVMEDVPDALLFNDSK